MAKRMVLVRTAPKVKRVERDEKIQVRKLPHLLKMARIPTTIVARVVQKETWYAIHIHLAAVLYASKASFALLPNSSSSSSEAFSFTEWMADSTALSAEEVEVAVVLVTFKPQISTGLKTNSDSRFEQLST